MNHDWRTPRLSFATGAQIHWCARCGKLSPSPRDEKCEDYALTHDPDTGRVLYATDVTRRLMDCIREGRTHRKAKSEGSALESQEGQETGKNTTGDRG